MKQAGVCHISTGKKGMRNISIQLQVTGFTASEIRQACFQKPDFMCPVKWAAYGSNPLN